MTTFGWKHDAKNPPVPIDIAGLGAEHSLDRFLEAELPAVIEMLESFKAEYEDRLNRACVRFEDDETWCAITEVLRLR